MGKKGRRQSKSKPVNPVFYVFCEGDTEDEYVRFLRREYRIPIEIKPKVLGTKVSDSLIKRCLKGESIKEKDKVFLFYDLDRDDILIKLRAVKDAIIIGSNPCCELWFKLHHSNHTAYIRTDACIKALCIHWPQYERGAINEKMRNDLRAGLEDALRRSKALPEFRNPSSSVYKLIDELEKEKK